MAGDAPTWVYFLGGASALTYLHLDCIDGKQARRTKSSSPLGQLFDHGEASGSCELSCSLMLACSQPLGRSAPAVPPVGSAAPAAALSPPEGAVGGPAGCDAMAVHLLLTTVACSLNLGGTWKAVAASMAIMVPWGYAHWEEYPAGTMLYGNGFWGITEANYALVLLHFITAAVRLPPPAPVCAQPLRSAGGAHCLTHCPEPSCRLCGCIASVSQHYKLLPSVRSHCTCTYSHVWL